MHIAPSAQVHPSAILSPETELGEGVRIGPYVVFEGHVRIGAGTVVKPYCHLLGPLVMGCDNQLFSGCILGERPQHLRYGGEPTSVEIGDGNIFREHVTVHRGTTHSWKTVVGNRNFLMAGAHVGHDCIIGNHCLLTNGSLVGGHCVLEDNVYLSGNSATHQFVRMGRLSLLSGLSGTTKDVPPFIIQQHINCVVGVNVVGMRRAGMSGEAIDGIRQAFHIIYRRGMTLQKSLPLAEQELGHIDAVRELVAFIRNSKRGINLAADHGRMQAA